MTKDEINIHNTLKAINNTWLYGQPEEMKTYLHPEIAMKLQDSDGEIFGYEKLIASFIKFCKSARILEYSGYDEHIDIIGNCAIISFKFEMIYERLDSRYKSAGHDLWIFEKQANNWVAIWRSLKDLNEVRISKNNSV